MNSDQLVEQGNQFRSQGNPEQALACYAQAFVIDRNHASAFNNYGNVLRELGDPRGAIPFLERAISLYPDFKVAKFNLAVSYLLAGDYQRGWPAYEARWDFEHLEGTLPTLPKPRWQGEDLKDKTILVVGEQGHGDNIQFVRFLYHLHQMGGKVLLQVGDSLIPLFSGKGVIDAVYRFDQEPEHYDFWIPIMSIPALIGLTLERMPKSLSYLVAPSSSVANWAKTLGPKTKMRIGICWSGRRDTWINQHKGLPFEKAIELIKRHPQHHWINLQVDCTAEEEAILANLGVLTFPGQVNNFSDTAGLLMHLDVVLSVDTAVAHLAGSLGRSTWIMLNNYAVDWRWLLNTDSSPWYPSAILYRQPGYGNWDAVIDKVSKHLTLVKI